MDYFEWAQEYYHNARRVQNVMNRKKQELKDKSLTADQRKRLTDDIKQYRHIYHELLDVGDTLTLRAEGIVREA